MEKFNRGVRRHHAARLKHNRKHYHANGYRGFWNQAAKDLDALERKNAAKYVNTPTPCSCSGCGNPRKHMKGVDKVTLAERRFQASVDMVLSNTDD